MQFGVSGGGGAGSTGTEQHPESKMGHVRFKATLPEIYLLRVSSILHPGGKKEKSCNFLFPGIISAHSFRKQVAVKTAALGGRDAGEVWGQMPLKKIAGEGQVYNSELSHLLLAKSIPSHRPGLAKQTQPSTNLPSSSVHPQLGELAADRISPTRH